MTPLASVNDFAGTLASASKKILTPSLAAPKKYFARVCERNLDFLFSTSMSTKTSLGNNQNENTEKLEKSQKV
jgi:hypothetical protein